MATQETRQLEGRTALVTGFLCLEAFPRMAARGTGYLVNILSILSTAALDTWTEAGLRTPFITGTRTRTRTRHKENTP